MRIILEGSNTFIERMITDPADMPLRTAIELLEAQVDILRSVLDEEGEE